MAEDILVVGGRLDDWPGKDERLLRDPYCGLVYMHTLPMSEEQMIAQRREVRRQRSAPTDDGGRRHMGR